jgi:hypothetical protein
MGKIDEIDSRYRIDYESCRLAIINDRLDILKKLKLISNIDFRSDLLIYCLQNSEIYFYLRNFNLHPNISIYNRASQQSNLDIIQDINDHIGISKRNIINALESNCMEIIPFLLKEAIISKISFDNLIIYPIINDNIQLILEMEEKKLFEWHPELYYPALLSGSFSMVKFVESRIPNIHDNFILDTSKSGKKGRKNLLLEEIIYEKNNRKYFSHTINYAIQGKSIDILKYIREKGYGITISNIITCIKQGTCEMLAYSCEQYVSQLPYYILQYFGLKSFIPEKFSKLKYLIEFNCIDFSNVKPNRLENIHFQMICESNTIDENIMDSDYLLNYSCFFKINNSYINSLFVKTRIFLQLNRESELNEIFNKEKEKQFLIDILFLFGNINQIKKYHSLLENKLPNLSIISELLCYCQLSKICYLVQKNLIYNSIAIQLFPIVQMLGNNYLNILFERFDCKKSLKYLLHSENLDIINNYLENNSEILDIELCKKILNTGNLNIIKKFSFPKEFQDELYEYIQKLNLETSINFY